MVEAVVNARQAAMIVWTSAVLVLVLLVLLRNKSGRDSLRSLLSSFFTPKVAGPILLIVVWNVGVVWILHRLGYWNRSMVADTVTLIAVNSFVLPLRAAGATYDPAFFLKKLTAAIGVSVFAELIVNMYTFSFWVEIILVPMVSLIALLVAVSGLKPEFVSVHRLLNYVLAFLGLAIVAHSVWMAAINYQSFFSLGTAKAAVFPFILALLNMPSLYALCALMAYDDAFIPLRLNENRKLTRYGEWRLVRTFHVRLQRLQQFRHSSTSHGLSLAGTREDIEGIIQARSMTPAFCIGQSLNPDPPSLHCRVVNRKTFPSRLAATLVAEPQRLGTTPSKREGGQGMAKVAPYHTTSPEHPPEHRNVYHDHDDCPDGKRIKWQDRVSGTGNRPRCDECIKLG